MNNLFGINIEDDLRALWMEKVLKENGVTDLDGAEYSEHITMLQRNAQKIKLALSNVVIRTNQYLLDHMSSKTDLNNVRSSLSNYIRNEKIASSINDSDITKLVTISILKLLKDEMKTDYQSQINVLKDVLKVSDSTLDELREIVAYIKLNREILSNLHITKMAGYTELDTRICDIDTLVKDNQTKLESLEKRDVVIFSALGSSFSVDTANTYYDLYTIDHDTSEYSEYISVSYTCQDTNPAKLLDIIETTRTTTQLKIKLKKNSGLPYLIYIHSYVKI